MFTVNDIICYGTQGVCRIAEIRSESLHGTVQDYYVLKPLDASVSTILVPMKNESLLRKMRPIVTPQEIDEMLSALPQLEPLWEEQENQRKELFHQILTDGDPLQLLRIVQSLYCHSRHLRSLGRHLHINDYNVFKRAEHLLTEEFSAALQIPQEQVPDYIQRSLNLSEPT